MHAAARSYPAAYDLRTLGKVTSVKDQGPYGTCWSFAATGSLESCLLPGESRDYSEDNMVLTSGFDNGADPYDWGGNLWMSTAYLVRWGGPVLESQDAYGDRTTPPGLTPHKHVQSIAWLPPRASSTDNDALKYALTTYGAVDASMSFQGSSSGSAYYNASTHAYYYDGGSPSSHEVLVVGWNDDYPASSFAIRPAGNGAFIVKNSWGAGWGDAGYFYVSYYDTVFGKDSLMAAYEGSQPVTNYDTVYQYDPLGDVTDLGYPGTPTAWFANVFTAAATGSLSAVGFYAEAPNTSYEIYAGGTLAGKTLLASGTLATMGYQTVPLPAAVAVTAGQSFVVAVKVTTPGYAYPMAIECPVEDYSSGATAAAGQSYVSADGTTWKDLTSSYEDANVCLKAYATTAASPPPQDSTPPVTSVEGIPAGWTNTPVTATFSATDAESGVAYTEYGLDGSGFCRGTSVAVASPGLHSLAYRSADKAGNIETTKTATIRIDTSPPTTVASGCDGTWHKKPVTVTLRPADDQSGVAATEYSLDGKAPVRGSQLTISKAGAHTLTFHSADNAGNVEATITATVGIDPKGPVTIASNKVTVAAGNAALLRFKVKDLTPTARVTIKIYKGSALKKILAVGSVPTGSAQTLQWACTLSLGTYTWKVYAVDLAGNKQKTIGSKALVVK
jgi:C1A family cysteine protease